MSREEQRYTTAHLAMPALCHRLYPLVCTGAATVRVEICGADCLLCAACAAAMSEPDPTTLQKQEA